jgi:hypothetical protein
MRMKIPTHNAEGLVRESKFRAIAESAQTGLLLKEFHKKMIGHSGDQLGLSTLEMNVKM